MLSDRQSEDQSVENRRSHTRSETWRVQQSNLRDSEIFDYFRREVEEELTNSISNEESSDLHLQPVDFIDDLGDTIRTLIQSRTTKRTLKPESDIVVPLPYSDPLRSLCTLMLLPLELFYINIQCHLVVCVSALFLLINLPLVSETRLWPNAILYIFNHFVWWKNHTEKCCRYSSPSLLIRRTYVLNRGSCMVLAK